MIDIIFKNIKIQLFLQNKTMKNLEKETGIKYHTLYAYKIRGSTPKLEILMKIADYLNISLDELIK